MVVCVCLCMCIPSHVWLFATSWTLQAPLSMGFPRQECWSGLPCPFPGNLPDPGTEPQPPMSPALAAGFFISWATREAPFQLKTSIQNQFCTITSPHHGSFFHLVTKFVLDRIDYQSGIIQLEVTNSSLNSLALIGKENRRLYGYWSMQLRIHSAGLTSRKAGSARIGREVWGRMDTCICMAESLHCSHKTIALLIGYTLIQNKKFLREKKKKSWIQGLKECCQDSLSNS